MQAGFQHFLLPACSPNFPEDVEEEAATIQPHTQRAWIQYSRINYCRKHFQLLNAACGKHLLGLHVLKAWNSQCGCLGLPELPVLYNGEMQGGKSSWQSHLPGQAGRGSTTCQSSRGAWRTLPVLGVPIGSSQSDSMIPWRYSMKFKSSPDTPGAHTGPSQERQKRGQIKPTQECQVQEGKHKALPCHHEGDTPPPVTPAGPLRPRGRACGAPWARPPLHPTQGR